MDRASKLIRELKLPGGAISGEEIVCAAWPQAVGKRIAARSRAARMVRMRLVVEVEDGTWQKQLWGLRGFILTNLVKQVGAGMVEDLEFRVVPRRMEPRRAMQSAPALFADEADAIEDPVLRGIYKRKRALG